jgi:uncharacterized protein YdeI (YjbR/CyaY-like superfamily)
VKRPEPARRAQPLSLTFRDRAAWRRWLEAHHAGASEVWIVYFKKGTGTPSVTYPEALEEALCFGWIDGVRRRVDEERFTQRFTPRREGSRWSEVNRRHARRLLAEGRMAPAGLARLPADLQERLEPARPVTPELPGELETELRGHARAWATFEALAPSYRRLYVRWITEAKRPETRARRLAEAVGKLERGEKLGMK